MIRVLVLDDVAAIGRAVQQCLREVAVVDPFVDPESAFVALRAGAVYDVLLCDMELGASTGADFERRIRDEFPALVPHLGFMSGGAVTVDAVRFLGAPGRVVIEKPFDLGALRGAISRLLGRDW